MIAMVDLQTSNLQSVYQAFLRVGVDARITGSAQDLLDAAGIVLPGVGTFGDGMAQLDRLGLRGAIQEAARKRLPILGICLGMQLLADSSEEFASNLPGLGLIRGQVVRLQSQPGLRVPNMGWCDLRRVNLSSRLLARLSGDPSAYFAHSYWLRCENSEDVAATTEFGLPLTAAIERENIFGVQFHPEKSQDVGLTVLDNFVRVTRARVAAA